MMCWGYFTWNLNTLVKYGKKGVIFKGIAKWIADQFHMLTFPAEIKLRLSKNVNAVEVASITILKYIFPR